MVDRTFWRDVRVHVVSVLIAAFVLTVGSWALGWWPAIWRWIVAAGAALWSLLLIETPVPLFAVAALLLAIVLATRALERARRVIASQPQELRARPTVRPAPPDRPGEVTIPFRFQPDEVQERVLKVLAEGDGAHLHPTQLQGRVNVGGLILDKALRGLEKQNLVKRYSGGYGGMPGVYLTERGADYVIEAGYARGRP